MLLIGPVWDVGARRLHFATVCRTTALQLDVRRLSPGSPTRGLRIAETAKFVISYVRIAGALPGAGLLRGQGRRDAWARVCGCLALRVRCAGAEVLRARLGAGISGECCA